MKKLLLTLALLFPLSVWATPTTWDFAGGILQPLQSQWSAHVKLPFLTATSTTQNNTLPKLLFTTATGTSATTTNFYSIGAVIDALRGTTINGFGLTTCESAASALTWGSGVFGCHTISAGAGGGGGTWATTTSTVSGQNINYPLEDDDIVTVGANSTTTAEFWFDPNITLGKIVGSFWVTASSTLANFTFLNATGTKATTTDFFSTTGSFTNFIFDSELFDSLTDDATLANNGGDLQVVDVTCTNCLTTTEVASADLATLATNVSDTDFGDLTVSGGAWAVEDDSHAHTGATLSGIDIGDDTNLTAGDNLTLTGDDLDLDTTLTGLTAATFSGLVTAGNYLATGSSTLQNFTAVNSTTTNATTTNLNVATSFSVTPLTSALILTNSVGTFAEYAGTSCTNQFVRALSALGAATCESIGNEDFEDDDWGELSVASGVVTIDDNVIESEHFGDDDWGEITIATNVATIDDNVIESEHLGDDDWGDITIASNVASVEDDSHAHTGATLSGIDISDDTNLTAGDNLTLTGDDLDLDTTLTSMVAATFSGLVTSGNYLATGSSTFQRITATHSTTTNATSTNLAVSGDLAFYGEIMPDGLLCDDGEILKKTGAGDWDCATDDNSGGGGAFPFDVETYGVSTSTVVGFTSGLMSLGSTTITQFIAGTSTTTSATTTNLNVATSFSVTPLTSALILTNSVGTFAEYTGIDCTNQFVRDVSALGAGTCATVVAADVDLADLTATNSTLTFSGTYDGQTARTIGLNLGNANVWTALQSFTNADAILATGSSTLQNFTFRNATGTNATTTNSFTVGDPTAFFKVGSNGSTTISGATAATSSAYIYSTAAGKGGSVILEDTDGAGCTEIMALNGVLSSMTVTCPTEI